MGTPNAALQTWLLQQKPDMTKAAMASAISEMEDSFIKAAQDGGTPASELLKIAQEQPDTWNNLVNNYVSECVVASQQAKQAAAQAAYEDQEKMAAAAEAVHLGEIIAHSFLDELNKIAEEAEKGMPPALAQAMRDEDKDDKDDKKDKSEPDKDDGAAREPDKEKDEKKEGRALPLNAAVNKMAIEKKAAAGHPTTTQEMEFLALCKLAESGYPVDFSGVK